MKNRPLLISFKAIIMLKKSKLIIGNILLVLRSSHDYLWNWISFWIRISMLCFLRRLRSSTMRGLTLRQFTSLVRFLDATKMTFRFLNHSTKRGPQHSKKKKQVQKEKDKPKLIVSVDIDSHGARKERQLCKMHQKKK